MKARNRPVFFVLRALPLAWQGEVANSRPWRVPQPCRAPLCAGRVRPAPPWAPYAFGGPPLAAIPSTVHQRTAADLATPVVRDAKGSDPLLEFYQAFPLGKLEK